MPKTWRFKVRFTIGGSGKGHGWTNTLHAETDEAIDSPGMATLANNIGLLFRAATLDIATIQSVTVSDPTRVGQGYNPLFVRTVGIGLNGQHPSNASGAEVKEVVGKFRLSGSTGRPGSINLRMCFNDDQVQGVSLGEPGPGAVPAPAMGDLAAALNAAIAGNVKLHVWNRRKSGAITDNPVVTVSYAGPGHRDSIVRKRKKAYSGNPKKWVESARKAIQSTLEVLGGYTAAKAALPALESVTLDTALPALEAGLSELAPALLALL